MENTNRPGSCPFIGLSNLQIQSPRYYELVKSPRKPIFVIPAEAGIQEDGTGSRACPGLNPGVAKTTSGHRFSPG
jgi:hypothetical protein